MRVVSLASWLGWMPRSLLLAPCGRRQHGRSRSMNERERSSPVPGRTKVTRHAALVHVNAKASTRPIQGKTELWAPTWPSEKIRSRKLHRPVIKVQRTAAPGVLGAQSIMTGPFGNPPPSRPHRSEQCGFTRPTSWVFRSRVSGNTNSCYKFNVRCRQASSAVVRSQPYRTLWCNNDSSSKSTCVVPPHAQNVSCAVAALSQVPPGDAGRLRVKLPV